MDTKVVGEKIAFLRREKGLTQKELAAKLCVTAKAVSRWENGLGFPDVSFFPELAGILGVNLDFLMLENSKTPGERKEQITATAETNYYEELNRKIEQFQKQKEQDRISKKENRRLKFQKALHFLTRKKVLRTIICIFAVILFFTVRHILIKINEKNNYVEPVKVTTENGLVLEEVPYNNISFNNLKIYYKVIGFTGENCDIVIIPFTYNSLPIMEIESYAFKGSMIKNLELADNNLYIKSYAFENCISLKSIESEFFPKAAKDAFKGCKNISLYLKGNGIQSSALQTIPQISMVETNAQYKFEIENLEFVKQYGYLAVSRCLYYNENADIVIPHSINIRGKDYIVTVIQPNAFKNSVLKSLEIPDTINTIREDAFYNMACENLRLPKNFDLWKPDCLNAVNAGSITIEEGLTVIPDNAFIDCTIMNGITLPKSLITIGYRAFAGNHMFNTLILPDALTKIGPQAFDTCIKNLVLPASIREIDEDAFAGSALSNIFFRGSEAEYFAQEWLQTTPLPEHGLLNIYFYSDTKPAAEGNYWHFFEGGITVWQ